MYIKFEIFQTYLFCRHPLKTLLEVCIRKGMGMKSILGRIEDAINKRYSPKNYDDTDMEKATLVLRIGVPRLLHVLHITDGLPSVSLTYPKNKAIAPNMIAGVDSSFEDRLKNNIASYSPDETTVSSLKMDEIATEERLRWNKEENKIHQGGQSFSQLEFQDISRISRTFLTIFPGQFGMGIEFFAYYC